MKTRLAAPFLFALAFAPVAALAQGGDLLYLKNSPAAKFNADDFKMLRGTVAKALSGPADGPALDWSNDKTGAAGTVTPMGADDSSATRKCRKLRIANSFKFNKDEGVYTFCLGNTGKWALKP